MIFNKKIARSLQFLNVTDIAVMLNVNMESLQRHFQTLLDTREVSERIKRFIRKNYKFNINEDERIDGN